MKKNLKKNNKGFTLTELIVVIVIIAILAAVLIPSLTGYIKKARRSNDVQLSGEMNRAVELYCSEYEVDRELLCGTDVRTILKSSGFDLKPRTDNWTFVYNKAKLLVEVIDIKSLEFNTSFVDFRDPSNYNDNMFLLGKGDTPFEEIVNELCNISDVTDHEAAVDKIAELLTKPEDGPMKGILVAIAEKFKPATTLYVSNATLYTAATNDAKATKAVYVEGTTCLPKVSAKMKEAIDTSEISKYNSAIIKVTEEHSVLSMLYKKIKMVDEQALLQIDLSFVNELVNGEYKTIARITLDKLVNDSVSQSFTDEIVSTETIEVGDEKMIKSIRKFTVSYYDGSGVYARGSIFYTTTDRAA